MTKKALQIILATSLILSYNFTVFANNNDITPPELKSVSITEEEVRPGDTLHIEMEATDSESGMDTDQYSLNVRIKHQVTGNAFSVYMNYNSSTGKYEGAYTLPNTITNGEYEIWYVALEDKAGNRKLYYPIDTFTVIEGTTDITPPELKSVSITEEEVRSGDTLHVEMEATDSESGMDTDQYSLNVRIKHQVTGNAFSVYMNYNSSTGKYEGTYTLPNTMTNGEYEIWYVALEDKAGNRKLYYPIDTFTVLEGTTDITPPELKSVSITEEEVRPGDTLHIEMEATDSESGMDTDQYSLNVRIKHQVTGNAFSVYMNYNSSTGKYEGTYTLPNTMTNGEYVIWYVALEDEAGNRKLYYPTDTFTVQSSEPFVPSDIKSVTVNLSGTSQVGTPIRWTVDGEGTNVQYAWYVYQGNERVDLFWYSNKNVLEWTPKEAGDYRVRVFAKDSNGNTVSRYSEMIKVVKETFVPAEIRSVTADLTGTSHSGAPIKWTVDGEGTNVKYAWYVYKGKERVDVIWYSDKKELEWTPKETGDYRVRVYAKDGSGNTVSNYSEMIQVVNETFVPADIKSVTTNVSGTSQSGTPIRWTVNGEGTNVKYAWYVYQGSKRVDVIWYSDKNELDWTPEEAGDYRVRVYAKDGRGQVDTMYSDLVSVSSH